MINAILKFIDSIFGSKPQPVFTEGSFNEDECDTIVLDSGHMETLKKEEDNTFVPIHNETLSESVSAVFKELNEMSQEEFDAELKKYMTDEPCDPETCSGECQGMGWCKTATEFREKIIPKIVK